MNLSRKLKLLLIDDDEDDYILIRTLLSEILRKSKIGLGKLL